MKNLYLLVFVLIVPINLLSQSYKQVKIYLDNQNTLEKLQQLGIQEDHFIYDKDNTITIFLSELDYQKLKTSPFQYQILIDDWHRYYNSYPILTESEKQSIIQQSREKYNVDGFGFGSMGGYYTFNEIVANLDLMYQLYPNIITQKYQIGTSHQGRPIWAVKISDNPNITENEHKVGYDALMHSREPQSMASLMYFMWYLLQNYGTNPEVTSLVNNREMFFVPCFNPDGYEYNRQTNPNGGGMWRKNRRNNGGGSFGVDLNRNFGFMWGYDNIGSSPDPNSETYRGPSAFSEPESQAVRDLAIQHNYRTHFNMHSYQNAFLYPWGYINAFTPDHNTYVEFSTDMCAYNGYTHGTVYQILGYNSNGSVRDWMYGDSISKQRAFGYTVEIGSASDGFWPPQHRIFPLAQGMLLPNLYNAWVAGEYIALHNYSFSQQYFNPFDTVRLNLHSIRNKGLRAGNNISLRIHSDNSQIIFINNNNINIGNIQARSSLEINQNFTFVIGNIPPETNVRIFITSFSGNSQLRTDTLHIIIGTPILLFSDTTNNINTLWNLSATPSTPIWGTTSSIFFSAPNSYTDSPTGNYANNATVTMTLKNPVNLQNYSNPKLRFYTRYDIENNYDYGQVRISTNNGISWTSLAGSYTNPGTGNFQPNGEPLYDGTQLSWVLENISLAGFNANQNKIRFELRTDPSVQRDGWYLDDISIFVYGIIPVELNYFYANIIENNVHLHWSTSSEVNNFGFEIQRKVLSSNTNWTKIGFVNGAINSSKKIDYTFVDPNPIRGDILYRLKQIDLNGDYKIYPSVYVKFAFSDKFSLNQNYPNPFNPFTEIEYSLKSREFVELKIYDMLGNQVANLVNEMQDAGNYKKFFDASNLSSGIYIYRLKAGSFIETKKMVLIK